MMRSLLLYPQLFLSLSGFFLSKCLRSSVPISLAISPVVDFSQHDPILGPNQDKPEWLDYFVSWSSPFPPSLTWVSDRSSSVFDLDLALVPALPLTVRPQASYLILLDLILPICKVRGWLSPRSTLLWAFVRALLRNPVSVGACSRSDFLHVLFWACCQSFPCPSHFCHCLFSSRGSHLVFTPSFSILLPPCPLPFPCFISFKTV